MAEFETPHALYCLAVLHMTPEETAIAVWPDDVKEARELRAAWVANRWAAVCELSRPEDVCDLGSRGNALIGASKN